MMAVFGGLAYLLGGLWFAARLIGAPEEGIQPQASSRKRRRRL